MDYFSYRDQRYHCEEVDLEQLAQKHQTPCYVYSLSTIKRHGDVMKSAFCDYPATICFAVKANSNINLLREVFELGLGADVVSQGELMRALHAGVDPSKVMFSGVGKTKSEIAFAIESNVKSIHVESQYELDLIAELAESRQKKVAISLRLNPNIDAKTNPKITTGLYSSKFGMNEDALPVVLDFIAKRPLIDLRGIGCHIGSQIVSLSPFIEAAHRMVSIAKSIQQAGHRLKFLDFGGGLGIRYSKESPPSPAEYAKALIEVVQPTGLELVLEPGRVLVGNAGVLITRVTGIKQTKNKRFVIVDAGMNDLMRPALYDARHEIIAYQQSQKKPEAKESTTSEVVGPICESTDVFGEFEGLEQTKAGDLLVIRSCGAYGSSLANNYNSRPLGAEVLIAGDQDKLIARAQTYEEIWQREVLGK